ncbi:hypothetical protein J3Q07_08155 [Pseudomonas sp. D4-18]|uniref:hypothetical protein n=1 Tax=Pseudomonas sp. D4-18 TaxID=2817395 RepID=UPI003DA94AB0
MESVTRFWSHEARNIRCVREADYDAALGEIAALEQSEKLAQETVTLALSTGLRVSRENEALQQRLTVQDQRVDELEGRLARAQEDLDECDGDRHRLRDKCAALQSEAERLKTMSDNYCSLLMDANSELTKARELLKYVKETWNTPDPDDADLVCWDTIDAFLSNQSAPALIETLHANGDRIAMEAIIAQQAQRIADLEADKGQGEQVAYMPVERCYDVRAKMIIAFNESRKNGGDLDDGLDAAYKAALRYSPSPMIAEQPAPVAVVMPELDDHDRSGQNYWADQAAQGRPYEQQLREACERNGIDPGLDDE